MISHGFEEVDHTGDLALRVWGDNFYDLLEQAAKGLYHLLEVDTRRESLIELSFSLEEDTREAMLVDFLNELLYQCQEKGVVFQTFSFTREAGRLQVQAWGKRATSIGRNIKAVTFHALEIHEKQARLVTTITFDV